MIKTSIRKHNIKKSSSITCEDITHRESLDWINSMVIRGYNVIDFKIETYTGNYPPSYNEKVRCVVEYIENPE